MKKILLPVILLAFMASTSMAQTNKGAQLSIGPEIGLPLGQANQVYSVVFGGSLKLEEPIAQSLNLTFTAGFNSFTPKSEYSSFIESGLYIPVEVGLKNYISGSPVFVELDLGASINANSNYSGSQVAFMYAPIIGVSIPSDKNAFDIGVRYEGRVETGGTISQLALRLAYKFSLK